LEEKYLTSNPFVAFNKRVIGSPTSRTSMLIKESHIVAIFELADT